MTNETFYLIVENGYKITTLAHSKDYDLVLELYDRARKAHTNSIYDIVKKPTEDYEFTRELK